MEDIEYRHNRITVKRMGDIEVPADNARGYRLTHGYAVFVDGVEQQPWLPLKEVLADAEVMRANTVADGPTERDNG